MRPLQRKRHFYCETKAEVIASMFTEVGPRSSSHVSSPSLHICSYIHQFILKSNS